MLRDKLFVNASGKDGMSEKQIDKKLEEVFRCAPDTSPQPSRCRAMCHEIVKPGPESGPGFSFSRWKFSKYCKVVSFSLGSG